jgi:leucyl/phenylalanyl-tRNA--protein transferase
MKMDFDPYLWCWFSPDPRMLLFPAEFKTSRSLGKVLREQSFDVKVDRDFRSTIESCASVNRPGQESTWIERDMIEDYIQLHRQGTAHSIEAYQKGQLVGGLYGLSMGKLFFGESMFHHVPEASKACLAKLVEISKRHEISFIDCQVHTPHLESMGAREVGRSWFLDALEENLNPASSVVDWREESESS